MVRKCMGFVCLLIFSALIYADIAPAEIKADYGGSFRLRQEYMENTVDFETLNAPDRDFFRLRSSLWGKVDFNKDVGFYARITNEARYYMGNYKPFEIAAGRPGYETSDSDRFDEDELVIDNLYFDVKNLFGLPVDLRIGRQDFVGMYGEGFVILDGTPGDGSRTNYFNAAKATWRITNNHALDLIYYNNTQKDEYLPSLHPARSDYLPGYVGNERLLNISDERGFILYGKNKLNDHFYVEPYYIYKQEDSTGDYSTSFGGPQHKLELNTLGARLVITASNWKIRAEYAHQFGEYDDEADTDREGDGGYLFIGQKYADVFLKPEWEVGYIYMSGNDSSTGKNEGWDPLFSRAPSWNEVSTYPMLYETRADSGLIPAYWTNMHLYKIGLKLALASATNLALSYQYLRAVEETSGLNTAMFSNDGKERGHVGTLMLTHTFTKQIDGYLQAEFFNPGDFYADSADNSVFLRWQLMYKF